MMKMDEILRALQQGAISVERAQEELRKMVSDEDLGFSKIDHARRLRTGMPEVIYGAGKTSDQILAISQHMLDAGSNVLATKVSPGIQAFIAAHLPSMIGNPVARTFRIEPNPPTLTQSTIAVVAAGTSDLPVVEEACETALFLGNRVERFVDVGIAGIHRLFARLEEIRKARVVIVVAGMEGALPGVVAGLVSTPVIAVPTSVGYGSNFGGLSALLSMLNSCTPLSVVNIDNGFGAAVQASRINRIA